MAIPVSVAAVFAPMNLSGLSLNIMSLGGLALGIGMLVDSGIVVVESISRCREEGDPPERAVVRGTSEVGTAVVASTLTTVAVFFPMVFVEGVAGQVFTDLALTVVYALLASLAVSVFLVPALTARVMEPDAEGKLPLRARLARVLRYRSLGPLSRPEQTGAVRFASRAALAAPVLLAVAALLSLFLAGWSGLRPVLLGAASALALIGAIVLLLNFVVRLREAAGLLDVLAAVVLIPVEAVLFLLETAWLALVCLLTVVVGPLAALAYGAGLALRLLLWPLIRVFDALFPAAPAGLPVDHPRRPAATRPRAGLAAVGLALTVPGFTRLDSALIPEVHQGEFDLEITLPVGTPLEQTLETVAPLERWALEEPRIDRVLLRVGADPEADSDPEEGEHTARLSLTLADAQAISLPRRIAFALTHAGVGGIGGAREEELIEELAAPDRRHPDLQAKITRPVLFSFRTPVEVEIEGYDLAQLRPSARRRAGNWKRSPGSPT